MTIRKSIPKNIKENVMTEYNHRCAICGGDKPQVHHIDTNHENNEIQNLIPLCPNCHLIDQHNPSRKMPVNLLKLFRQYKDPLILDSKFIPIFERMEFLFEDEANFTSETQKKVNELLKFIETFDKGNYYKKKLDELLKYPPHRGVSYSSGFSYSSTEPDLKSFKLNVRNNRNEALKLLIELLRYQNWV